MHVVQHFWLHAPFIFGYLGHVFMFLRDLPPKIFSSVPTGRNGTNPLFNGVCSCAGRCYFFLVFKFVVDIL